MMIKSFYHVRNLTIYLVLCFLICLITFGINYAFLNENIYFQSFGSQLTLERIDKMIVSAKKWEWLVYAFLPFEIILRVFYTAVFLYIGIFFTEMKIGFGKLFRVALLSDFVYVLAALAKLIVLIFFKKVSTLEDLQFSPLSVMELINKEMVDPLFHYPLSLLNLFELTYFFVLAWLLIVVVRSEHKEINFSYGQSIKLVITSYGSGILLWALLVMFITLNLS